MQIELINNFKNWLKLLESYISEGEQHIHIDLKTSKPLPINYRVPQGSVLGPLL